MADINEMLVLPQEVMSLSQLPVIMENLASIKGRVTEVSKNAAAMECTEETLKSCKEQRAKLNKLANACEDRRKEINAAIMKPYDDFLLVYEDCVRGPLRDAVGVLNNKIKSTEQGIKDRAEDSLRQYFAEVIETRRVQWLRFEQLGIKIGLTDARNENLKKLKQQILDNVDHVADDVAAIRSMGDDAPEVMTLYKQTLNLGEAHKTVIARNMAREAERIHMEQEKEEQRRRQELQQREKIMQQAQDRVVTVFQPEARKDTAKVENEPQSQNNGQETAMEQGKAPEVYDMNFTVRGTLEQLRALKAYIKTIGLEVIK